MFILLSFVCVSCHQLSSACPMCVNTIAIDPLTGLPPDVEIVNGKAVPKAEPPSEEAKQRSDQQPVCDTCISGAVLVGKPGLITAEDRHNRFHV